MHWIQFVWMEGAIGTVGSTSCRGRWENVQETWQHCQVILVKKLVQNRCIHNSCKVRDKAQRPSVFKSKPSGQLTCSTPELRAQLNLTKQPKGSDQTWKACPVACSYGKWLRAVS